MTPPRLGPPVALTEVDPPQVGFEVEQGVVGEQHVDQRAGPLERGDLLHPEQVRGALGVQVGG
jgi:hypothetical protein